MIEKENIIGEQKINNSISLERAIKIHVIWNFVIIPMIVLIILSIIQLISIILYCSDIDIFILSISFQLCTAIFSIVIIIFTILMVSILSYGEYKEFHNDRKRILEENYIILNKKSIIIKDYLYNQYYKIEVPYEKIKLIRIFNSPKFPKNLNRRYTFKTNGYFAHDGANKNNLLEINLNPSIDFYYKIEDKTLTFKKIIIDVGDITLFKDFLKKNTSINITF